MRFSMKKYSMLALAALCSIGMLSGCSEDEPDPTRGEICSAGLSADCLIGTWNLNGVTMPSSGEINPSHDFSAAPAQIEFFSAGGFSYKFAGNSKDACGKGQAESVGANVIKGTWTINGTGLQMNVMSTCYAHSKKTVVPTFTVEGALVKMDFNGLYLLDGDEMAAADPYEKADATEIYTISAE